MYGGDRELTVDVRAVGIATAGSALLGRLPIFVVVAAAAAATALARQLA